MSFPEGALVVINGEISLGAWGFADDFMVKDAEIIPLAELVYCRVVSDRHETYQTGVGRVAGGIIGGVLLGPLGAAGGLLAGGKRRIDETIIYCRLADERSFTAQCSQLTAAKFIELSETNQRLQRGAGGVQQIPAQPVTAAVGGTIECPMCAETIKARALICRFCGFKIAAELEQREKQILEQSDTAEVLSYSELYERYITSVDNDDAFLEGEGKGVLNAFARIRTRNPSMPYREAVDVLREELGLENKSPLLDFFREGFKFARGGKKFTLIQGSDRIVLSTQDWGS